MVYDCFTFFNEIDLLEFRLKVLDSVVDFFVIVESNITFSGNPKIYNFEKDKERFKKWEHKIIYFPLIQTTNEFNSFEIIDKYNPDSAAFNLEYELRNSISNINDLIKDDDFILLSDIDEIPNPRVIIKLSKKITEPLSFTMLNHYYFFNCQNTDVDRFWQGTILSNGEYFKNTRPQELRNNRYHYKKEKNGGWHFSYLGGVEKIKYKIQSFAHTEYNKDIFLNDKNIQDSIKNGRDILNREGVQFKYYSLFHYPFFLRKIMLDYPLFIFDYKETLLNKKFFLNFKKLLKLIWSRK